MRAAPSHVDISRSVVVMCAVSSQLCLFKKMPCSFSSSSARKEATAHRLGGEISIHYESSWHTSRGSVTRKMNTHNTAQRITHHLCVCVYLPFARVICIIMSYYCWTRATCYAHDMFETPLDGTKRPSVCPKRANGTEEGPTKPRSCAK